MNLNCLQTLIAVRDYGTFSAAARQIGLTQPAVSLQIQALEEEFGAQLVVRNARTCELTPAGEVLVQFAEEMAYRLTQTQTLISQLTGEVSGPVHIGASNIPGEHILPQLVAPWLRQHPQVKLILEIADTEQVMEWLDTRRIDFGVVGALPNNSRLAVSPLAEDELLLTVLADHPWANQTVSPEQLGEFPFVAREPGSGTRVGYESALRDVGVDPDRLQTVFVAGSTSAVLTAVEAGLGYAFCSRWAVRSLLALGRVACARVEGINLRRQFYVVAYPDRFRTLAAEELLAHLRGAGEIRTEEENR
ncbi:MAG: LysR substrate-binding domain-containing protein [Bacillota bacterium]|jgi:DNA-binding transcriptional LysR family regulator